MDGHIFISVLAYHLLHWIGYQLEMAGDQQEMELTLSSIILSHAG